MPAAWGCIYHDRGAGVCLDSDVFITAQNAYYGFDICPGFWKGLLHAHSFGRVRSIDRVRNELLFGRKEDDLVQWVKKDVPAAFFHGSTAADVSDAYGEIMLWVQRNPQYFDRAKAKFATEADGWMVAYSMVYGTVVVTNEQPRPESRKPRPPARRLRAVQSAIQGYFPHAEGVGRPIRPGRKEMIKTQTRRSCIRGCHRDQPVRARLRARSAGGLRSRAVHLSRDRSRLHPGDAA
ncbi:MAG: DUF4411 family protein [Acidobacteriota bacterium]